MVVVVEQRTTPGGTRRTVTTQQQQSGKIPASEHKSSLLGTSSNLINAIVGSGIVGIPFALRQSGFGAGVLLIVFCAAVTDKSLRLLVDTAKHAHVPSYETLAEAAFGVSGFRFVAVNMFVTAYGAMVSYLMLVKDSFGALLLSPDADVVAAGRAVALDSVSMRRTLLLAISLAVMLPLSCKRDVADLAHTSRLNVVIDAALVALVVYNAPLAAAAAQRSAAIAAHAPVRSLWLHADTFFVGLGVLSFAFVCQHSAFIIAGSLERPTTKRWGRVTGAALAFCAVLALICGVVGFLGYRDDTRGNILDSLPATSATANVARGLLGVTMLFVYPLESFVARHVCVTLLFTGRAAHDGDDANILSRRDRRVGLTAALYLMAVVPAALASDLGPVLALTGAIGGSCLSYIGPGLVYVGVHGGRFLQLAQQAFGAPPRTGGKNPPTVEEGIVLVSAGHGQSINLAVESTPLVAAGNPGHAADADVEKYVAVAVDDDAVHVVGVWNHIIWYITGMPLWCAIARTGQARLREHITELAMKSPHPIRIGDVEYKRVVVEHHPSGKNDGGGTSAEVKKMGRESSLPQLHQLAAGSGGGGDGPSSGGFTVNQKIGQGLLAKKTAAAAAATDLEADPQGEPPSWYDFYIAICYILFGMVALFAGIYSIFM